MDVTPTLLFFMATNNVFKVKILISCRLMASSHKPEQSCYTYSSYIHSYGSHMLRIKWVLLP